MILKMNTNILPLLNPGLYGTILGSYYEDVPTEDSNVFKIFLCEKGKEIMNELLQDEEIIVETIGEMEVDNVTFYSPQFYNYGNDEFDFDLKVPDNISRKILDELNNGMDDFFEYIKRFGSRDGFISYMPYTREKYIEAIQGKDLERSVAMFIMYLVECGAMCYSLETYQIDLEDEMNDICYENGWYEYDDYEDYEMEEST
jgi:hypothetical protein